MMEPQVRFSSSLDGTRIAYAELGDGPGVPVISINSWVWTIDMIMAQPDERARLEALTHGRRVLTFDRRGIGASARATADFSLDSNVADLAAVADSLNAPVFHLIGYGDGAAVAAGYAAENPARVARLVLVFMMAGTSGLGGRTESMVRLIRENWSWARRVFASATFPEGPIELQRWLSSSLKQSMSAEMAINVVEAMASFDVTGILPRVQAPTLVVDFRNDSSGREIAATIPDARLLEIRERAGMRPLWTNETYRQAIQEFLKEPGPSTVGAYEESQSGTAVILFADIVDSTALTERLGDTAFREKARDLDTALRAIIRDNAGTPIEGKLLGDGVLATFASARQAIEAALACGRAGDDGGLSLHLGLHAGDVLRESDPDGRANVYGGAVNIASRISGLSAPGEVLVSETVRSLARTSSGVAFEDRGEQELKGVREAMRVWVVVQGER